MTDFVWEEPPPQTHRGATRIDWMEELRPLTERPGEWARVRDWRSKSSAAKVANGINRHTIPLVVGEWEARFGPVGDRWGLWVRYIEESA